MVAVIGDEGGDGGAIGQLFQPPTTPHLLLDLETQAFSRFGLDPWRMYDLPHSSPASAHHLLNSRIFVQPSTTTWEHTACGAGSGGDCSSSGGSGGGSGGAGGVWGGDGVRTLGHASMARIAATMPAIAAAPVVYPETILE